MYSTNDIKMMEQNMTMSELKQENSELLKQNNNILMTLGRSTMRIQELKDEVKKLKKLISKTHIIDAVTGNIFLKSNLQNNGHPVRDSNIYVPSPRSVLTQEDNNDLRLSELNCDKNIDILNKSFMMRTPVEESEDDATHSSMPSLISCSSSIHFIPPPVLQRSTNNISQTDFVNDLLLCRDISNITTPDVYDDSFELEEMNNS